jgi:adenylate cyclase
MAGALKIGDGDFSVRVRATTSDEIGRLSNTFNDMTKGLEERDKIKSAFGKFVNKEVAERVISGEVQLGGESLTAAIFFSDIRSFTAMSERLTPHEVVEFLNEYMTSMVACVNKTHGVVDKYIGDAIMAEWGVPYSRGNDTENAVNAALLMRKALADFNRGRGSEKKPVIKIGSGINTGEVIAGQIGSLERMEYTCIGDAVNLASRIESLNKSFKTDILISEHSMNLVRNIFRVEPMKRIRVKGKTDPQQIYAVLSRLDDPTGFKTIHELRQALGYDDIDLAKVNPNAEEQKYEIIE